MFLMATGEVTLVRGGPGGVRRAHGVVGVITPQANPHFYRFLSALEPHRRPLTAEPAAITQRAEFAAMLRRSAKESLVSNDRAATCAARERAARKSSGLAR